MYYLLQCTVYHALQSRHTSLLVQVYLCLSRRCNYIRSSHSFSLLAFYLSFFFLSLLGSPLKNRSHITVVYESTMSYREPVYRFSHPKSSTSLQEPLLGPRSCCYSKRLLYRSFPAQREWEFEESLQDQVLAAGQSSWPSRRFF